MLNRKLLLSSLLMMGTCYGAFAQTARVQVIHNCADAAGDSVDVYLNGTLLLDNFAFRTATRFIDAPAGQVALAVAPKNSTSAADAFYNVSPTLTASSTYVVVAEGIASPTGYNPAPGFALNVYPMGQEAAGSSTNTDVLVVHGSTDAPMVDVRAGSNVLVDDISYGEFSAGYLNLPTDDYTLAITNSAGTATVARYAAPLQTLNLAGQAIVVLASGFLNPANNSNGEGFGLYVALPNGSALVNPLVKLPAPPRVQVIHNCADAAADSVDVYMNGRLLLDNFAFRTASGFVDADYGTVNLAVAPKSSTSVGDAIYDVDVTLNTDGRYIVTAEGLVSTTGYNPTKDFKLNVFAAAREVSATSGTVDLLVHHGATDAPTVDVRSGSNVLVNDIAFGQYNSGYVSLPVSNYTVSITDASGANVVASYSAPLQTLNLQNKAITVLASGFLTPANNSNGPAFGLYAALPEGGALVALPPATVSVPFITGSDVLKLYPNPAKDELFISTSTGINGRVTIADVTGRTIMTQDAAGKINIATLQPGLYIVKFQEGNNISTARFVKD